MVRREKRPCLPTLQVSPEVMTDLLPKVHDSRPIALHSPESDLASVQVEILDFQGKRRPESDPGGKQQVEESMITAGLLALVLRYGCEKTRLLLFAEGPWPGCSAAGPADEPAGVVAHVPGPVAVAKVAP